MSAETEAWTVAIGNLAGPFATRRQREIEKAVLDLAREQPGFLGVHPHPPEGTLLLYRTENNAKGARNMLRSNGVVCGRNIGKCRMDDMENQGGKT